jgi:hypothetical protein
MLGHNSIIHIRKTQSFSLINKSLKTQSVCIMEEYMPSRPVRKEALMAERSYIERKAK